MNNAATTHALPTLALLTTLALAGCGADSQPPAPLQQAAPTGPRYATADELLAQINVLIARNPIDQAGLDALYYAENDVQRRLERMMRTMRPFEQLEHKLIERFRVGLNGARNSPIAPMATAEIIERSPQRALALTAKADGEMVHMYLVQIGEGWWVSGYTLERIFESPELAEVVSHLEDELASHFADLCRSFTARVDRGDFRTIEQARTAWRAHIRSQ